VKQCVHRFVPVVKAGEVTALNCSVCKATFSKGTRTFHQNSTAFEPAKHEYSDNERRVLARVREKRGQLRNYRAMEVGFDFDSEADRPFLTKKAVVDGVSASYWEDVLSGDREITLSKRGK